MSDCICLNYMPKSTLAYLTLERRSGERFMSSSLLCANFATAGAFLGHISSYICTSGEYQNSGSCLSNYQLFASKGEMS